MMRILLSATIFFLTVRPLLAQDYPDSSKTEPSADSTEEASSPSDSVDLQRDVTDSFQKRHADFVSSRPKRTDRLSYFDSLTAYFVSDRFEYGAQKDRSFFHDAGDYFRFDPSFFIVENQVTPMRKTVLPFGLSGGRLNYLSGDFQLTPFEHLPEPDGSYDFNDFPTALDNKIYITPGATGMIFGATEAIASVMTLPERQTDNVPATAFLADKGSFDYSYTRGRYSRLFKSGKRMDLSVGYRKADGLAIGRDDNAYHYFGDSWFPAGSYGGVAVTGHLYNRHGNFGPRLDRGGVTVGRDRFDRALRAVYDRQSKDGSSRWLLGYRHARRGSSTNLPYKTRFNITEHGLLGGREWISGNHIFQAQLDGGYREYDQGFGKFERLTADFNLGMARLRNSGRFALTAGAEMIEGMGLLPSAAAVYFRDSPSSMLLLSAGYTEQAPSLHELHMSAQQANLYGPSAPLYLDSGNPGLRPERQLIGSIWYEIGPLDRRLGLVITGGTISDGIEWLPQQVSSPANGILFSPVNVDLNFVNVTLRSSISINDLLRIDGGAAFRSVNYDLPGQRAYLPDYQLFSGVELYHRWESKLIDLFAYVEVVYSGEYDGYQETGLGLEPVINAKVSFQMKRFRFNYIFQNLLSNAYVSRESIIFPGRFTYYNITWNFID